MQPLLELWSCRGLVGALIQRHLALRYRGSALGFLWSFLNPLILMGVYTLVFRFYMRFDAVEHYAIFVLTGLLPWMWTASAIGEGTSSITSSGHLVTKSLFPPHVLPSVAVFTNAFHFLLAAPLLLGLMLLQDHHIRWTVLLLPGVMLLHAIGLLGIVYATSALNVFYRDVQHLVGHFLTIFFFLCPIVYPLSAIPADFQPYMQWNPFALLLGMYHGILYDGVVPPVETWVQLGIWVTVSLLLGLFVYSRYRERLAEAL